MGRRVTEPVKYAIQAATLRDHDGPVDVYVGKITRGDPYGYFDPVSGATEPPSGPEADIVKVLDNRTGAEVKLSDADYERVVEAVVEAAYAEEPEEIEVEVEDDYDRHDNDPEQHGFNESDLQ